MLQYFKIMFSISHGFVSPSMYASSIFVFDVELGTRWLIFAKLGTILDHSANSFNVFLPFSVFYCCSVYAILVFCGMF